MASDAQSDSPRVPKLLVRDGSLVRTVSLAFPARPARAARFVDYATLDALFRVVEDDPQFGGGLLWKRVDDDDHRFARARDICSGAEAGRFATDAIDAIDATDATDEEEATSTPDERTLWTSDQGICAVIFKDKRELFVLSPQGGAARANHPLERVAFASDHRAIAVGIS
ncbi:MAG: hypothetical protein Q8Q09_17240 [Deltaproteobacteria bacterium]|nr:hypothetical protein [Deltaproteobacteria bacterium]